MKRTTVLPAWKALIRQREAILSHIYSSHGWKALTVYYELRNKFLPEGTKRREIAKSLWKFSGKSCSARSCRATTRQFTCARTLSVEPVSMTPGHKRRRCSNRRGR